MIRVFPRRTKWTPTDELTFIGDPPLFRPSEQPVYVSVTFTWDIPEGERLKEAWQQYYPEIYLGGPAFDDPGETFVPGRFIKHGVTFTSRGCIRRCPWCFVPEREGWIRELAIQNGWIVQDNNLLACSTEHQRKVFAMLQRQPKPIKFAGGLDSRLLLPWHIDEFKRLRIDELWFACDTKNQLSSIERVADLTSDFPTSKKRCYVLIGFNGESRLEAEKRLETIYQLGFLPFAQLYRTDKQQYWSDPWKRLARKWSRPAAYRKMETIADPDEEAEVLERLTK